MMSEESSKNISVPSTTRKKAPSERGSSFVEDLLDGARFNAAVWCLFLLMTCLMVGHNVIIASWGIGTFPSITRRLEINSEIGGFTSSPFVDANGLRSRLRYAEAPAARFLHILPAGLWSVIAPLQLSKWFRSKFRTAHRRLGRLFVAMSISMAIGLVPIVRMDKDRPSLPGTLVLLCGAYFLGTVLLAIHHARNKRFAEHRVWMLRHVAVGYTVHFLRVLGFATWWILPFTVRGYTDHTQEGYEKRTFIFSLYFEVSLVLCVVAMEIWLCHTGRRAKSINKDHSKRAD